MSDILSDVEAPSDGSKQQKSKKKNGGAAFEPHQGKKTAAGEMFDPKHKKNRLQRKGKKTMTVRLVLANGDLIPHYQQLFADKQARCDPRISIDWLSIATFKQQLQDSPAVYAKDCLVIDEGDTVLTEVVIQQLGLAYPKHLVLLSAVPRNAWTGTQSLCFSTIKGRHSKHIDVDGVFPSKKGDEEDQPELLPEEPTEIVAFAVKRAARQPVLFYGKSSVYSHLEGWPTDNELITPVSIKLSLDA